MAQWIAQNMTGIGLGVVWGALLTAGAMAAALAVSDARKRRRRALAARYRRAQQARMR